MPTFQVTFVNGLNDVDHSSRSSVRRLTVQISEQLQHEITEGLKGIATPSFLATPTFFDREQNAHGLAFAISKTDEKFTEHLPDQKFRYKSAEVERVLTDIITAHSKVLSGEVRWDRGFGMFVYNIYYRS